PPPPVEYESPVVSSAATPPAPVALGPMARLNGGAADAAQAPVSRGPAEAESTASAKLGTGHGAAEWSPIRHTGFQRRTSQPEQLLEIQYDSQANLMAAGIMPRPLAALPALPRSFPNSSGGYVPDPP